MKFSTKSRSPDHTGRGGEPQRQRFEEGAPAGGEPYNSASHGNTLPFRPFLDFIITVFLAKSSGFPKKLKIFFVRKKPSVFRS